ncbi:MAG: methyltransferase domain-containing protein [Planctomycetota bacterium]
MPSSRPETVPPVISLMRRIQPESILDVGTGFGKWGVLFREYMDIVNSEDDPPRYRKEGWRVRIDGIEGFPGYLTPLHDFVYDAIHQGNALDVLPTLGEYDVIFLGDVIEHLDLAEGRALIRDAIRHARRYVVLTTPGRETKQGPLCGNALEQHRSLWSAREFRRVADADVFNIPGDVILAVYRAEGQPRIRRRDLGVRSAFRRLVGGVLRRLLGQRLFLALMARLRRGPA